jgi:hypothetical protein
MSEGLTTADGTPVDVAPVGTDEGFAAVMAAQARNADAEQAPAPPRTDPEAPYGRKADGTPKKAPGRPRKAAEPRVQAPSAADKGQKPKDYTEALTGVMQLAWGVTAPLAPADAAAIKISTPAMVKAWNGLAQENARVARGIDWLTSGSAVGAAVMVTVPLVLQLGVNHGVVPHQRLAKLGVRDPAELAEVTRQDIAAADETARAWAEQEAEERAHAVWS